MRQYLQVFKLSLSSVFEYRFDFLMERVRNLALLLTLYFLWKSVYASTGSILGFAKQQVFSYILISNIVFSFVCASSMNDIAFDISSGQLSSYLVKPINYLGYWFTRRLAGRLTRLLLALFETYLFVFLVRPPLDFGALSWQFAAVAFLALAIFTLTDYLVGLSAFWTQRAYGPRFLVDVLIGFAGGRFFPLYILPFGIGKALGFSPFAFMVYWPAVYLAKGEIYKGWGVWALVWLALLGGLLYKTWKKGLKAYEAYGG